VLFYFEWNVAVLAQMVWSGMEWNGMECGGVGRLSVYLAPADPSAKYIAGDHTIFRRWPVSEFHS
jgi:hypothetical protein